MTEKLLDLLSDGKWHSLFEIAQRLKTPVEDIKNMSEKLCDNRVVEHVKKTGKIRLSSWLRKLPSKIVIEDGKVIVASIIMPSESIGDLLPQPEGWGFHFSSVFTPTPPLLWGASRGIFGSCFTGWTRSFTLIPRRVVSYGGHSLHGLRFGVAPPY
jgi:hypothetical protein